MWFGRKNRTGKILSQKTEEEEECDHCVEGEGEYVRLNKRRKRKRRLIIK